MYHARAVVADVAVDDVDAAVAASPAAAAPAAHTAILQGN